MRKAHFIRHSPCPKCGSRDNLGLYSDGSAFCFGCGFVRSGNVWANYSDSKDVPLNGEFILPKFPDMGLPGPTTTYWLSQYGIGIPEAISRNVGSDTRNRTCFSFEADGKTILVQARNHNQDIPGQTKKTPKYITYGKPDDCIPLYYFRSADRRTDCLVLVEDCISAIKVARLSDSMPILRSDLSLRKLTRLKALYGRFRVWLDGDMYHKACRMADRLQMMGCEAIPIYSELDPKCYNDEEIKSFLKLDMSSNS